MAKKESGFKGDPNKLKKRKIIIWIVAAVLIATAVIVPTVLYAASNNKTSSGTAKVRFGTLTSSFAASGVVEETKSEKPITFGAYADFAVASKDAEEEERYAFADVRTVDDPADYVFTWRQLIDEHANAPVFYRLEYINDVYAQAASGTEIKIEEEPEIKTIFTLKPYYFDWEKADVDWVAAREANSTSAQTVNDFLYEKLSQTPGFSAAEPNQELLVAAGYALAGESEDITTAYTDALALSGVSYFDEVVYGLKLKTGLVKNNFYTLQTELFSLKLNTYFASFLVSEYDVSDIYNSINAGNRIYGTVAVNALNGRKLLAEIYSVTVYKTTSSSSVAYFKIYAQLIFPQADAEDGQVYKYYDQKLDNAYVKDLGCTVAETENIKFLTKNEVVVSYTVSLRVKRASAEDVLIVQTKCIKYDTAENAYVVRMVDGNKEEIIYVSVLLSTGTEAAVAPESGYSLQSGDDLIYESAGGSLLDMF